MMKSYLATLKDVVAFVRNESVDVVSELLTMGFTPAQLVHDFSFDEKEVMSSEVYKELDEELKNELAERGYPFVLDGFNSFDAAIISHFELSKEEFLRFKETALYNEMFACYEDELVEPETEVLNQVFDDFENKVFSEFQKNGIRQTEVPENHQAEDLTEDTYGLSIAGHIGTWHTIDHTEVNGHTFWLMRHDEFGESAPCVIVDSHGNPCLSDILKGFDEYTVELLQQEIMPVDHLPDDSISVPQMKEYGYCWGGMLPLREAAAIKLWNKDLCPVYRLYESDTEDMIMDVSEFSAHAAAGGIFGVAKVHWIAALENQKTPTDMKFSDVFEEPFARDIDTYFEKQGWQLQLHGSGAHGGYQVFFGEGVQVDNQYEYGFPYLLEEDELAAFAKNFYDTHLCTSLAKSFILGHECGVLLTRDDAEFEQYACNNPALPYGFYDEDQGFRPASDLDSLRKELRRYVDDGVDMTYAVISEQGPYSTDGSEASFEELDVNVLMDYSFFRDPSSILYSACKIGGEVKEGFLEVLIKESQELGREETGAKPSLTDQIRSASGRVAESSSPDKVQEITNR